jgi:antitoxin MazE
MLTSVQKWGNSLAVRIPKEFIKETKLHRGAAVEIMRNRNTISITPLPAKKNQKPLEAMLAKITDSNLHSETDWGKKEGHETW